MNKLNNSNKMQTSAHTYSLAFHLLIQVVTHEVTTKWWNDWSLGVGATKDAINS